MLELTTTVDAKWRVSRLEFQMPMNVPTSIYGFSEITLSTPEDEISPELAKLMRNNASPTMMLPKTYGAMPASPVTRMYDEIKEQTVEVEGVEISMETVFNALLAFCNKWKEEDQLTPTPLKSTLHSPLPPPLVDPKNTE